MKPLHPVVSCRTKWLPMVILKKTQKNSFVRTMGFSTTGKVILLQTSSLCQFQKLAVKQCNFRPHQEVYYSHFTTDNRSEFHLALVVLLPSFLVWACPQSQPVPSCCRPCTPYQSHPQCNRVIRIAFNHLGSHKRNLLKSYLIWEHCTSSKRM